MLEDVGVIATPWKPANAFVYGVRSTVDYYQVYVYGTVVW